MIMGLFGFGKKKVEKPVCDCGCGCDCEKTIENVSGENVQGLNIKVLGSGCKNCHTLHENTKSAVASMGIDAQVEYVTDMAKIAGYGVMSMPALVVNEKVVSMGRVLNSADIEKLLRRLGFGN